MWVARVLWRRVDKNNVRTLRPAEFKKPAAIHLSCRRSLLRAVGCLIFIANLLALPLSDPHMVSPFSRSNETDSCKSLSR